MRRRAFLSLATALSALVGFGAKAGPAPSFRFPSIDGGFLDSADWRGHPVLVINTASLCGFSGQLREMQALHEQYGPRGLVVLAVPSGDFAQELPTGAEVRAHCALEYGLDLPMTDILPVAKDEVHPFYAWLRQETGFVPRWNFAKVLLDPEGQVLGTWGSFTRPGADRIVAGFAPYLTA